VCEDNLGYVGGFGDLVCARNSLLSSFPEYSELLDGPNPVDFYKQLAEYYRSLVLPGQQIILLYYPSRMTVDNEERRVRSLFKKFGLMCMVVPTYNKRKRVPNKTLSVTDEGVFVVNQKKGIKNKVGLVVIDAEPFDIDPRDSSVKRKIIIDEAKYWLDEYQSKVNKIPANATGRKALHRASYELKYQKLNYLLQNDKNRHKLFKFLRRNHHEDLKETLNQGVSGLLDCYYQGLVKIVNGPGLDFVGDKLFCTYMDNIIQFYLKEKPILNTIPTLSFCSGLGGSVLESNESSQQDPKGSPDSKKLSKTERKALREDRRAERVKFKAEKAKQRAEGRLLKDQRKQQKWEGKDQNTSSGIVDAALLSQVFDHIEVQHHVVIKRVDGRGGDAVWVGPKISREQFLEVRDLVMKNPEAFIVQKYIPLSQVDGQLVDIRCLSNVTPDSVIVSQTFWGRGVPAEGSNGKVNISDRGFEFCIATAKRLEPAK